MNCSTTLQLCAPKRRARQELTSPVGNRCRVVFDLMSVSLSIPSPPTCALYIKVLPPSVASEAGRMMGQIPRSCIPLRSHRPSLIDHYNNRGTCTPDALCTWRDSSEGEECCKEVQVESERVMEVQRV